ncbi:MAG TPA: AMP-binding protein [Pseudonocardia sp.]
MPEPELRLDRLFEAGCDWLTAQGRSGHLAVHAPDGTLSYHDLDCLANQLARYLLDGGAAPGDRIGVLLEQGTDTYIAMLAVLKIQAVYVRLDLGFPADRIGHLITEGGMRALVSDTTRAERLHVPPGGPDLQVVLVDAQALEISRCPSERLGDADQDRPAVEQACLVFPEGQAEPAAGTEISHAGVCNFALTTAKLSGIGMEDRVFEGLSGAPWFSVEAIWVAWIVGAVLIPAGSRLWGAELRRFLATNRVTALYCTPAMLASLDEDLPEVRYVLLSGQVCPRDLLMRWHRPGRRVISVYGTTEPNRPVTGSTARSAVDTGRPDGPGGTVRLAPAPGPSTATTAGPTDGPTDGPGRSRPLENGSPADLGAQVLTSDAAAPR